MCTKCKEEDPSVENDISVLTLDQVMKSLSVCLFVDKICDAERGVFTFTFLIRARQRSVLDSGSVMTHVWKVITISPLV